MPPDNDQQPPSGNLEGLLPKLEETTAMLAATPDFSKGAKVGRVLDLIRRVILQPGGCAALESRIADLEAAGVFKGTDWAHPAILVPSLTTHALKSADTNTVVIEALSELRLLAVARGDYIHPEVSAEQAHHYLSQVLALNLAMLFTAPSEAERETQGRLVEVPRAVLNHLAERIGYEYIIDQLIDEIWRILRQRPIQVEAVKQMITQIAICRADPNVDLGASGHGAERLVSSLFGPTQNCRDDPGVKAYRERLDAMDTATLQNESIGFARAMHDTGLVSPYHAVLLRFLRKNAEYLIADALGLSTTGRDGLLCYRELVLELINEAVHPATAQAVYGLALTLERGVLYQAPMAPALWRQLSLPLSEWAQSRLRIAYGDAVRPQTWLMGGVLSVLGLPLGIGQGNNPTCQSARALSLWSFNDPDYMLQILAWAARDDEVVVHFEGQPLSSANCLYSAEPHPLDLDPVSLLLVPHLDYIYNAMGQICAARGGDPHRWVNPEFHGWWVGRGFHISVDVASGQLVELENFLRHFYAYYHPYYNGNQPLIHPQPAGIAITDSAARFIGWHAISIQRVALDPGGTMRVYFFNPNNDSGQDWGDDVEVSTEDNGELYGESSLPFEQFASRLYIFHYDPLERGEPTEVTREELDEVIGYVRRSWGAKRLPASGLQADPGPQT